MDNMTDWSIPRLFFLVDEDEVDLALPVREEGGGVVLAPDQVQVHRRGSGVPRGPRVRRRGVLQDLRGNEKTRLSLEPSGDAQNSTALQEPYGQAQRRGFITQAAEMKKYFKMLERSCSCFY